MNVMCEISGCEVKCSATSGQQFTDCTMWGECPQAMSAEVAIEAK
jgi:hypothetical protein